MTKAELDSIREFVQQLPSLRIQMADGPLLDRCQQALHDLIEAYQSEYEENETRYPEPAHIEEVPREVPIPPHLHREPGPPPEPEPEEPHHAHHKKTAKRRVGH